MKPDIDVDRAARDEWLDPTPEIVTDGVVRIPLPMPGDALRAVNVYALAQPDGLTLIDGGWAMPEARAQLDDGLYAIGEDARSIRRILVTHAHRDHYTLAVVLRRELGMPISLGAGERQSIEALTTLSPLVRFESQRALLRAAGASDLAELVGRLEEGVDPWVKAWEHPDTWLEPSTIAVGDRELTVVPTPGHTQGHVVFADTEAGLLFSGDHVLPHITPSIGFETVSTASPLRSFLESLAVVRRLPDLRLLPAHGPVSPSSHRRVDELVAHHDARLRATSELLSEVPLAAAQVAACLGWTRHGLSLDDLDAFNQMLAIGETVAHLTVLVAAGEVRSRLEGDVVTYTRAYAESARS
jgi:glyoxylase-like metal-dependent hydrolase (beta-lactamase superfamily II)